MAELALPLIRNGICFGVLSIYAVDNEAFDEGEIRLLGEAADDLAYGIGGQMTARIGKKKPSYIGFYYAFRGLVARDPFPGKQMPTCAGPCDTATGPSAWDTAAFFNFGIVFSR